MDDDSTEPRPPEPPVPGDLDELAAREYATLLSLANALKRRVAGGLDAPGTDSLVHETFLTLKSSGREAWRDRTHFIAVAALQLRHLLVDHVRAIRANKRGGDQVRVSLGEAANVAPTTTPALDVLILDQALQRLASHDRRQHCVAELRLFGLSVAEIGAVLEVSERTVKEDWRQAREFLAKELRFQPRAAS